MRFSSLYVHFPFCESKCHYCDFYSLGRERTRDGDADRFEAALKKEAALFAPRLAPTLQSIFFGGGTPSMTPPASMARALEPMDLPRRIGPDTEWTMEANPSSVDVSRLKEYRAYGVNRVSMGVQALNDELLLKLGRVHSRDAAFRALDAIFEAGFDNVSVDLLCGVPGQSIALLEEALEKLTAYPITHLSCYLLTLAKHHRMYPELPDETVQLSHLLLIDRWMTSQGFEHYEISNFARPGKRARHNLVYWKGGAYLGLGPSAHSFDGTSRWKNVSSLHKYAELATSDRSAVEWTENLTPDQLELERWMLALRLDEGFPKEWLKSPLQQSRAERLRQDGLVERHPERNGFLRLTARGFAVSDQIISTLSA